mgnify:CR=1 FL=1
MSFFDLYDNFENRLLDLRYNNRGLLQVRDDIATVDIDIAPFLFIDMSYTYNQNKQVESYNYVSTGVAIHNTNEQFFYNSNQQLSEKISIDLSSSVIVDILAVSYTHLTLPTTPYV